MLNIVAEDDRVIYLGRITGTHTGSFFQYGPTGNKVDVFGINDFRLRDGKVIERWGIFDVLGMMRQMGIGPGGH
jgi:predicted ester cyclase